MKSLFTVTLLLGALAAVVAQAPPLTLDSALESAKASRLALQASRLLVDSARAESRAMGAQAPLTFGMGQSSRADLGATDQDLFLSHSVDIFGRAAAGRSLGRARLSLAEADARKASLEVQSEVLRAFFEAAAATRLSLVAGELRTLSETLRQATARRFEEGKIPEVQVTRATIEFDRATQTATLRNAQLKTALTRLAAVTGLKEVPSGVDVEAAIPAFEVQIEQHPDLAAHRAKLQEAQAEAGIADRENRPELEVIALRSPWRESPSQWGARLQVTWKLFDFGRSRNERQAAVKRAESAQAAYNEVLQRTRIELQALELEIKAAQDRLSSYEAIRKAAVDLVEKSRRGYSEGFSSLLDVLEATRSLREVEQELAEARLALDLANVARLTTAGQILGENR